MINRRLSIPSVCNSPFKVVELVVVVVVEEEEEDEEQEKEKKIVATSSECKMSVHYPCRD